jgi:hypothetical protein
MLQDQDLVKYGMYCSVFNAVYPNAFICKITGDVVDVTEGKKRYILNEERLIKAECLIRGLKKTDVGEYFDKWVTELPRKLNFSLPVWDGKDHIKEVFSHVLMSNISQERSIDLIKEWFAGIFRRLEDNSFQNRLLLFEGPQGVGKDTLIANLFNSFGEYFSNIELSQNEKDSYDKMARNIVINISEFDRSAKISSAQIKNMITSPSTMYRKPYARASTLANFHCSFVSSCNLKDVLRDETGNRRFLFFNIQSIDWKYPKGISGQILAQAKALADAKYKAQDDSNVAMKTFLEDLTPENMDDIIVQEYCLRMTRFSAATGKQLFIYSEISELLLGLRQDFNVYSLRRILTLLKVAGFSKRTNNGPLYSFAPKTELLDQKMRSLLYYNFQ